MSQAFTKRLFANSAAALNKMSPLIKPTNNKHIFKYHGLTLISIFLFQHHT